MQGVGRELVLVDKHSARAQAEADDIRHAVPFAHPLEVRSGGFKELMGCRVVGSGTTLDTARFRSLLGTHCGVDSHHVHGYVVGEHGDTEVLTWSLVTVAGMPLDAFAQLRRVDLSAAVRREIDSKVRGAAYTIIGGKGATYYGIGGALARITD